MKLDQKKGKIWLKERIKPYRNKIVFLTVLTVFATALSVAFAYLTSYLVDSATKNNRQGLIIFACVILGVLIARITIRAITNYYTEKFRADIYVKIRKRVFNNILNADYAKLKKYHSGELVTRITSDSAEIANATVSILPQTAGMVMQFVGSLVALAVIDWLFTLFLILGGGIIVGISALFRAKMKKYYKEIMTIEGESRSFMQESIISILTVKAFGAESKVGDKSTELLEKLKGKRLSRAKLNSGIGVLYSFVTNAGLVFGIVWCAISVMLGNMDFGFILSVVLLMEQLQRPLNSVSAVLPVYYSREASGERLSEIDQILSEEIYKQNSVEYCDIKKIKVENVTFSYGDDEVLKDLTLDIEKGKINCIYGASGKGKSTLFKLLLCFYPYERGNISFETTKDGEIKNIPITANDRKLFSFVPQGNFLFTGTIYENLTIFSEEKDKLKLDEKVKFAIENACAEFVYELPLGLETVLTEQGGGLSEGQRQRLAIARAFVADRAILLFDESTSALDEETERRLIDNLKEMRDKTCVIISHRQAIIESAEKNIHLS